MRPPGLGDSISDTPRRRRPLLVPPLINGGWADIHFSAPPHHVGGASEQYGWSRGRSQTSIAGGKKGVAFGEAEPRGGPGDEWRRLAGQCSVLPGIFVGPGKK
ncbi:MAG: hypothetical protein CME06_14585 [Gemmatimonadetes bacterium]|nr:hypothetical protein [Gemmatimonadota bacterium]